jgi:hypothetical protein
MLLTAECRLYMQDDRSRVGPGNSRQVLDRTRKERCRNRDSVPPPRSWRERPRPSDEEQRISKYGIGRIQKQLGPGQALVALPYFSSSPQLFVFSSVVITSLLIASLRFRWSDRRERTVRAVLVRLAPLRVMPPLRIILEMSSNLVLMLFFSSVPSVVML